MTGREKILLLVLGVILAGVGGYYGGDWYLKDVARLSKDKAAKAADLERVEEKVRNLKEVELRLAEAKQLQEEYERLVPKSEELPQLLRDTATMLTTAGVTLDSFVPGKTAPAVVPELNQLGVAVSTKGTYREILKMFESLRSWRRLIGIRDFSIGRGEGADPILACNFNMVVFYAKK